MKQKLLYYVDEISHELINLADNIFDNNRNAHTEVKSSDILCRYLEKNGFSVEREINGAAEEFCAGYSSGNGGATVGLLCEYDVPFGIENIYDCHMQASSVIGAALSLKSLADGYNFSLVIYGVPHEEPKTCELPAAKNKLLDKCDAVFSVKFGENTHAEFKTLAMKSFIVTFNGIKGPSMIYPDNARSATDAMFTSFHGIEYLREHIDYNNVMNYSIIDGGGVPMNIVPDRAVANFRMYSPSDDYLEKLSGRFYDVVNGAALMHGCTADIECNVHYHAKLPVPPLIDIANENIDIAGAKNISESGEKLNAGHFSNIMNLIPGITVKVALDDAVITAAKILSGMGFDIISSRENLEKVKNCHISI